MLNLNDEVSGHSIRDYRLAIASRRHRWHTHVWVASFVLLNIYCSLILVGTSYLYASFTFYTVRLQLIFLSVNIHICTSEYVKYLPKLLHAFERRLRILCLIKFQVDLFVWPIFWCHTHITTPLMVARLPPLWKGMLLSYLEMTIQDGRTKPETDVSIRMYILTFCR